MNKLNYTTIAECLFGVLELPNGPFLLKALVIEKATKAEAGFALMAVLFFF